MSNLKKKDVKKIITRHKVYEEKVTRCFNKDGYNVSVWCNKNEWKKIVVQTLTEVLRKKIEDM